MDTHGCFLCIRGIPAVNQLPSQSATPSDTRLFSQSVSQSISPLAALSDGHWTNHTKFLSRQSVWQTACIKWCFSPLVRKSDRWWCYSLVSHSFMMWSETGASNGNIKKSQKLLVNNLISFFILFPLLIFPLLFQCCALGFVRCFVISCNDITLYNLILPKITGNIFPPHATQPFQPHSFIQRDSEELQVQPQCSSAGADEVKRFCRGHYQRGLQEESVIQTLLLA